MSKTTNEMLKAFRRALVNTASVGKAQAKEIFNNLERECRRAGIPMNDWYAYTNFCGDRGVKP